MIVTNQHDDFVLCSYLGDSEHDALSGMLFLNVLLLNVITVIATTVGLVLFILPGLFVFVICSLSLWYMFARYGIKVGISKSAFTFIKSTTSIV